MKTHSALVTDLYELTMAAAYFDSGFDRRATFELYCHTLPPRRAFLVVCGLREALDYILNLRFTPSEVRYLKRHPVFRHVSPEFFRYLKDFRFTGRVRAMAEGDVCFANEPVLQVEAPMIEAQVIETYLLSVVNIETLVASKAARVVRAASSDGNERPVVDFGSRRAHGPEAGILAARAAYIGGCTATSNVFAGRKYHIPVAGTMAHSWVQAFGSEETAFARYQKIFPEHAIFLVDTYDTLQGARTVAGMEGFFRGVRLDSGDLLTLSRQVRQILDRRGRPDVKIVASGNLDEYKIAALVRAKAPIDFFGVGTEMVVSGDAPSLDLTYKLVQTEDAAGGIVYTAKFSRDKRTVPGRKQVYRLYDARGRMARDIITLAGESPVKGGRPLLHPVVEDGRLCAALPEEEESRGRARDNLAALPDGFLDLKRVRPYPIVHSRGLQKVRAAVERLKNKGGRGGKKRPRKQGGNT